MSRIYSSPAPKAKATTEHHVSVSRKLNTLQFSLFPLILFHPVFLCDGFCACDSFSPKTHLHISKRRCFPCPQLPVPQISPLCCSLLPFNKTPSSSFSVTIASPPAPFTFLPQAHTLSHGQLVSWLHKFLGSASQHPELRWACPRAGTTASWHHGHPTQPLACETIHTLSLLCPSSVLTGLCKGINVSPQASPDSLLHLQLCVCFSNILFSDCPFCVFNFFFLLSRALPPHNTPAPSTQPRNTLTVFLVLFCPVNNKA